MRYSDVLGVGILSVVIAGAVIRPSFAQDVTALEATASAEIRTSGAGLVSKVAPGEFLPVSIKLLNFGSRRRVDVAVFYEITDIQGDRIYAIHETVAVETTAAFVKTIQIPFETLPGSYTVKTSLTYKDQKVPATTEFPFVVERKIGSLFWSDFYLYGGIVLLAGTVAGIFGYTWVRRRRVTRTVIDYSHIPKQERVFYELISDTIAQMRQHVGDRAIDIAQSIDGLVLEGDDGKVLEMKTKPSKIIALLIAKYETILGRKVSFSLRKSDAREPSSHEDKGLVVIKKS